MAEPIRQIDEKIAWHERKIEIAEHQIKYHTQEREKLMVFKEKQRISESLGMDQKQTNQYLELLEAH
jgi:hypothetical protein